MTESTSAPPESPIASSKTGAGKKAAKIVAIVLVAVLLVAGIGTTVGYLAYKDHQKKLAEAAERKRLSEIEKNVQLFKQDIRLLSERKSFNEFKGLDKYSTGQVLDFEDWFADQYQSLWNMISDHDDAAIKFNNEEARYTFIAQDDGSLTNSKKRLADAKAQATTFTRKHLRS